MWTVDLDALGLRDGERVLDLGCGEGRHVHALRCRGGVDVVGADLAHDRVAAARDGLATLSVPQAGSADFLVADALRLPFGDRSFDHVVCSEVLEHLPDYRSALREIDRVLRAGGTLSVSVPRFWPEWLCWRLSAEYHREEGGHVRIFRASRLRGEIEALGLRYQRRHWAHALHTPYWWLQCLLWRRRSRSRLVRAYHRLLVWDLMRRPALTRMMEAALDPVLGKSVVLYFAKDGER